MFRWSPYRRARARLWSAAPALLLLALVPSLSYMGHWDALLGSSEGEAAKVGAAHTFAAHWKAIRLARASAAARTERGGGEWAILLAHARPVTPAQDDDHATHETHCHRALGSCSEKPAPPNLRNFFDLVELPELDLPAVLMEGIEQLYSEVVISPPLRPPRGAAAV
jgi:hypothetical protein